MDLYPDDEANTLRQASVDWLTDRMALASARLRPPGLWTEMADMGWLSMTSPADADGLGLTHATEALVFAEMGRFLAPVAALSTAIARRWFGTRGKVALALASGLKWRILDADASGHALAAAPDGTCISAIATPVTHPSLDLSTMQALIDVPGPAHQTHDPRAYLHLALLAAAYALGTADAARDMGAGYAAIREQFGQAIGAFQGVKHPCADMAVRCAVARSQLYYAACAIDAGDADAAFHIAAAKRLADSAALDNARANIQVHGGIGMTDEATPQLLLKRAHLLSFVCPVSSAMLVEPELAA